MERHLIPLGRREVFKRQSCIPIRIRQTKQCHFCRRIQQKSRKTSILAILKYQFSVCINPQRSVYGFQIDIIPFPLLNLGSEGYGSTADGTGKRHGKRQFFSLPLPLGYSLQPGILLSAAEIPGIKKQDKK